MASFYNLSHGMVAGLYYWRYRDVLPRTATLPYRSISPRRVLGLYAYAGVCINPP